MANNRTLDSLCTHITKEGYLVIPVKVWPSSSAVHHMYAKRHQTPSNNSSSNDPTLFVLNVPPFMTEDGLERLFGKCGSIKKIYLHEKPTSKPTEDKTVDLFTSKPTTMSHKVAYVVYNKKQSLEKALDPSFQFKESYCKEKEKPYAGISRWCCNYGSEYVQPGHLKKEIDEFLASYDEKQTEEKQTCQDTEGVPDEDGWTTVTHHSRKKGMARTESSERRVMEREKRKRKQKELLNFYAFQQKQQRSDHLARLRKSFEEDKKKVEKMKSARKFRPY